jgi:hypothetical protein
MTQLPFRVESRLASLLGGQTGDIAIVQNEPGPLPRLRCQLAGPAAADVTLLVRVHTTSGIPVAYSRVDVARGARAFETENLTLFAMEGYSHLAPADRQNVEARVWSRRAYATASAS